jgi:YD repeat-containing protein
MTPDGQHQVSEVQAGASAVTTAFTHDEFGRLTALDHTQGATSLAAYTWSYDAAGQLLEQPSPDGSVV